MSSPFDLDRLRLPGYGTRKFAKEMRTRIPAPSRGEEYFGGRMPMGWLKSAIEAGGSAPSVGVILWHLAVMEKSGTVTFNASAMLKYGMARFAAARGLAALETAKLVKVDRHIGRIAIVTILEAPNEES